MKSGFNIIFLFQIVINIIFLINFPKIASYINIYDFPNKRKIHLKNICKIYNKINKYNIDNIDIIDFIENTYVEIEQINNILEMSNDNNDIYFKELFENLKLIPNDNRIVLNIIKQLIKFIDLLNNNEFILSLKESYNNCTNSDEKKYLKYEINYVQKIFNNEYFEYLFLIFNVQLNIKNTNNKIEDINIYKNELIKKIMIDEDGDLESINDLINELNENRESEELKLNLYEEQLERYISKKLI